MNNLSEKKANKINWSDKDEYKTYMQEYYINNKQRTRRNQQKKVVCSECGHVVQYTYLNRHMKSRICRRRKMTSFYESDDEENAEIITINADANDEY